MFYGLFIGIDRYASPDEPWLSCAGRDAIALHALFSDTLQGDSRLLVDEAATRQNIEAAFQGMATCRPDDTVVIAFSGHGTPTHELMTYDADRADLSSTAISLQTLAEWFACIPASRVICFLDCCFSGGAGAKVIEAPLAADSIEMTAGLLDQLSGAGRLIVTASTANQRAWEHPGLSHGLLTYYLLQAMLGAEEVVQDGRVNLYRLLDFITQRVGDAAERQGKIQSITVRGHIDGGMTWPVFKAGARFHDAFPDRSLARASKSIHSLLAYGFPPVLLEAWARTIPSLNQLQLDAINDFHILRGEHLVVSAPTSSGKTMIGELAALKGTLERRRAFFLLPLVALVNDKHQQFTRTYGAFGIRTLRATGELTDDIPALLQGRYDLCLMTYEKFAALALNHPHILNQVGTIVVDEVQMIADPTRGVNLEFILTLLRMRRQNGIEPQVIALSAVIGDTAGLERWLDARLLRRIERPVPLDEGIVCANGDFRFVDADGDERTLPSHVQRQYGKGTGQDWVIPLVRRLTAEGKQAIVFRETKGEARSCALYLARALALPPAQEALDKLPTGDRSVASEDLRTALSNGIAFHTANLDREERAAVEEEFRRPGSAIRVIAATTTLAMGVNTPAEAVIVVGLEHPQEQPYSVAEYKNIIGRAGRLGLAERGTSYLMALTPLEEHRSWIHYVHGQPEDLQSRFLESGTDPRSIILRVLAAAPQTDRSVLTSADVVAFIENSFGVFQRTGSGQAAWQPEVLSAALQDLERHRLVEQQDGGRLTLTPLGRLAGASGVEVESMTRLVDVLTGIDPATVNDATLVAVTQLTVELDSLAFPFNKKSTQKEPQQWPFELENMNVPPQVINALRRSGVDQHQGTLRAKKAVACLLWMTGREMAAIEQTLTQFGGAFDGAAGPIRAVSRRTRDLLPVITSVAEILHPGTDMSERRNELLVRLEIGLPAAAVSVARHCGGLLSRGDYRRLIQAQLVSPEAIEASADDYLLACLEGNRDKVTAVRNAVVAHRRQKQSSGILKSILGNLEG